MKDFLNNIKKEYFLWMKQNLIYFPGCCFDATDILGSYLRANNFKVKRMYGYKNNFNNSTKFHMWLEYGNSVIDFTLFQFYTNPRQAFKKINAEDTYNYCIEEIQRADVVFQKSYYEKWFTKEEEYKFSFEKLANESSCFFEYLSRIANELKNIYKI